MSTPIDGWHSRTVRPSEFILIRGGSGSDNFMMNMSDSERVNENQANFAFLLGERSKIRPGASGSGAFGGKITIGDGILRYKNDSGDPEDAYYGGENSYGFGYKVWVYGKQLFAGGYNVSSYARESIVWGDNITIKCDQNKINSGDNNSTNNVGVAVFGRGITIDYHGDAFIVTGKQHTIGTGLFCSNISGEHMYIGNGCKWINVSGQNMLIDYSCKWINVSGYGHTIGNNCECVNNFGYENVMPKLMTDSTFIGYNNKAHQINNSDVFKFIYMFGSSNDMAVQTSSGKRDIQHVYIFGSDNHGGQGSGVLASYKRKYIYLFGHDLDLCACPDDTETEIPVRYVIGHHNKRANSYGSVKPIFEISCGNTFENDHISSNYGDGSNFIVTTGNSLICGLMTSVYGTSGYEYDWRGHRFERTFEDGIMSGWNNYVGMPSYGCAVFGSYNNLRTSAYSGKEYCYCGIIGDHNTIDLTANVYGTMLFGRYLMATASAQTIVGRYNSTNSAYTNAIFAVGTGFSDSNRATMFSVHDDRVKIGSYPITPSDASHVPEIPNKLTKTTTGSKKQVYGVAANNEQTMYEVSDGTGGYAGKEGKIYEMPAGGIPANDLGFAITGQNLYKHKIKITFGEWHQSGDHELTYVATVHLTVISTISSSYQASDFTDNISFNSKIYRNIVNMYSLVEYFDPYESTIINVDSGIELIIRKYSYPTGTGVPRPYKYGFLLKEYNISVGGATVTTASMEYHEITGMIFDSFEDSVEIL